ncbi:phosphotransferase [Candidatus Saccharibacteria bacterium]|nr:phosphotransferase [Candidatus Saccharibacteria bacterium]
MYREILPSVLRSYGIKYKQIMDFQTGYRNEIWPVIISDGQIINVTFFKCEPGIVDRINRADSVSGYLSTCGMKTRVRIDQRLLRLSTGKRTTYAGVYSYLPGVTIPWDDYTMERIKNLGGTLGAMHRYLSEFNPSNLPSVYEEYHSILTKMKAYFSRNGVANALNNKLGLSIDPAVFDEYVRLMSDQNLIEGQQPLHMDFVRGNVLFESNEVVGILDFEKTAMGHPVVDIARTLAFLLVDCKHKTAQKVTKYFLYSGYKKRGMNNDIGDDEIRLKLVEMFLLYDFYKFLAHNPYESLGKNEHYCRTKDILVKLGMISLS